jgi:hypothetical protein
MLTQRDGHSEESSGELFRVEKNKPLYNVKG